MDPQEAASVSPWKVRLDLLSARILVWIASAGRTDELRPEVHLFLYDRYWRLSTYYEQRGKPGRAERYRTKARRHYDCSGHEGPPFSAAASMPLPHPGVRVWAVSQRSDSDDAA